MLQLSLRTYCISRHCCVVHERRRHLYAPQIRLSARRAGSKMAAQRLEKLKAICGRASIK